MNTDNKKVTIFDMIKTLQGMFNSEPDIEEYDERVLSKELKEALLDLKKSETSVESGFNSSSKASSNGGFGNKMNAKTEKDMRKMHEDVAKKIKPKNEQKEYEIGD